eukprot:5679168-Pyramimonas_sp.AAC.1
MDDARTKYVPLLHARTHARTNARTHAAPRARVALTRYATRGLPVACSRACGALGWHDGQCAPGR